VTWDAGGKATEAKKKMNVISLKLNRMQKKKRMKER
jgi:hypothetical protein